MKDKPVLAAVAYVTDASGLPLGAGDILICDASDATARSGGTNRETLRGLVTRGVKVFSLPGLHAKVVVAGPRAIVGSSNWSKHSEDDLIEASLDTDDPAMVRAAAAFIRKQAKNAVQVEGAFLKRMPDAEPTTHTSGGGKKPSLETPKKAWLLATWPLDGHEDFRKRINGKMATLAEVTGDATLDWMRWDPGEKEGTRLSRGDRIVMIWHDETETVHVYPPVQIMDILAEDTDHSIIYAGASNHDERRIPWKRFKALADRIGLPEKVNPLSKRMLDPGMANELLAKWPKK